MFQCCKYTRVTLFSWEISKTQIRNQEYSLILLFIIKWLCLAFWSMIYNSCKSISSWSNYDIIFYWVSGTHMYTPNIKLDIFNTQNLSKLKTAVIIKFTQNEIHSNNIVKQKVLINVFMYLQQWLWVLLGEPAYRKYTISKLINCFLIIYFHESINTCLTSYYMLYHILEIWCTFFKQKKLNSKSKRIR